jgi:hypothetical protein
LVARGGTPVAACVAWISRRILGCPRVRRIDGHVDADDAGAFPHPGLAEIHHVGALGGGKAAASAADENHDRAIGFLDRDRMAQAIVVGHARRRRHIGGVLAGAKRHGKPDQRSRQAEGAPGIGWLL